MAKPVNSFRFLLIRRTAASTLYGVEEWGEASVRMVSRGSAQVEVQSRLITKLKGKRWGRGRHTEECEPTEIESCGRGISDCESRDSGTGALPPPLGCSPVPYLNIEFDEIAPQHRIERQIPLQSFAASPRIANERGKTKSL